MVSFPYHSAGRSEVGHVRRHNEDAILLGDDTGLWAVADGLGGHAAGDFASTLITERLGALPRCHDLADRMDAIDDELLRINRQLRLAARDRRVDAIASTVVVLLHSRELVACGWVGDSRAYRFDDGRLEQLTRDHVHGARSSDVTRFGQGVVAATPSVPAGVLTRAVGAEDDLFVDWVISPRRAGMRFVLCSDGINKELSDAEIETLCRRHTDPDQLMQSMVVEALARAGRDNISAVVVRLDEWEE
jgi:protein phosphatase